MLVEGWVLILAAYFLGSVPTAKIVGRMYGVDIQKVGSGNMGFANTYRSLGRKPALVVLFGDVLKGFLPVMLVRTQPSTLDLQFLVGLAAVLGHIFPVYLRFHGGKGMATALGLLLAISPGIAFVSFGVWFGVLVVSRIFSLASLCAAWSAAIISFVYPETRLLTSRITLVVIMGSLLHMKNIRRLAAGQEPKSWKW